MYCLETKDLGYRYANGDAVLNGIDLRVPHGSIYGFLGPNGAGKTTTLRLLLGLLARQEGMIKIFDRRLDTERIEILRHIGSLIESPSLYDHLTAYENLLVLQKIHRCPKSRIDEVLEAVDLAATGKKKTREFSLGMKQRLSIAAALLHSPSLLILDEPTNGLDPNGIVEMRQLLARLNGESNVTIIVSSHLLAEIERLVTHVGIINRGRMVFQGTMSELKAKQEQILSVCIDTDDNDRALPLVAQLRPEARISDGKIALPPMSNAELGRINGHLVANGFSVHELRLVRNDLETIFMELVAESAA
jgi:ABC-2 type transport system ATP-binding protein